MKNCVTTVLVDGVDLNVEIFSLYDDKEIALECGHVPQWCRIAGEQHRIEVYFPDGHVVIFEARLIAIHEMPIMTLPLHPLRERNRLAFSISSRTERVTGI